MAITFVNATLLVSGYDLSGQFNQVALEMEAADLDATTFTTSTFPNRVHRGGLRDVKLSGRAFWNRPLSVDDVFFGRVGSGEDVFLLFPENLQEGSTSTGAGFGFKGVLLTYSPGGRVGELLAIDMAAAGQGN